MLLRYGSLVNYESGLAGGPSYDVYAAVERDLLLKVDRLKHKDIARYSFSIDHIHYI